MSEIPQQIWLNMITNLSIRIVPRDPSVICLQIQGDQFSPATYKNQGFEKEKGEILSGVQEVLLEDARWIKAAWRRLKAIQIHVLQIRSLRIKLAILKAWYSIPAFLDL